MLAGNHVDICLTNAYSGYLIREVATCLGLVANAQTPNMWPEATPVSGQTSKSDLAELTVLRGFSINSEAQKKYPARVKFIEDALMKACVAIEIVSLLLVARPWRDDTPEETELVSEVLSITSPTDPVMDLKGETLFRGIFLFPMAVSFIVTGVAWRWMLTPGEANDPVGVNIILAKLGLEFTYSVHTLAIALQFYRTLGFRVVGTAERQARIGSAYVDEVIVERFL